VGWLGGQLWVDWHLIGLSTLWWFNVCEVTASTFLKKFELSHLYEVQICKTQLFLQWFMHYRVMCPWTCVKAVLWHHKLHQGGLKIIESVDDCSKSDFLGCFYNVSIKIRFSERSEWKKLRKISVWGIKKIIGPRLLGGALCAPGSASVLSVT